MAAQENSPRLSAGIACLAKDRVLLMRRSDSVDKPGVWAFPGGGIDDGETAEQAAIRELAEEAGLSIDSAQLICDAENFSFFKHACDAFQPTLNDEHDGYVWAKLDALPEPLHEGTRELLSTLLDHDGLVDDQAEVFAMDESVRDYDQYGRLRVSVSNISKGNICEYFGSEIPNCEALGLDPKKLYRLLRHPDELAKAVDTFNGIPILDKHVPALAWDHPKGKVIGTTGTDAAWKAPYLTNSLFFWVQDAIDDIESRARRELSSSYGYTADMTPGTYEGEPYDGVMRNILGNHVALVRDGRAGTDVIVGDSKPQVEEVPIMAKTVMSKKAALAQGVLMAFPKLAADKKPDFSKILAGVTAKNWKESKPKIAAAIKPFLAADADVTDVVKLLDHLDAEEAVTDVLDDDEIAAQEATDADPMQKILEFLKGKLSPEDLAALTEMMGAMGGAAPAAADEPPATPATPGAANNEPGEDPPSADLVSKPAMDAAIKSATDKAVKDTMQRMNDVRKAEDEVQPYVGRLKMAFDSAEGVYKAALDVLGVSVEGVHPSAYRPVLLAQRKPSEVNRAAPNMANDQQRPEGLADRFPDLAAVRHI